MVETGFFSSAIFENRQPTSLIAECGSCGLFKHCQSPKMEVGGDGGRKILIVGEAPGPREDEKGVHFVGKSGKLLQSTLARLGVSLLEDCWLTNAIICKPPKNAVPTKKQLGYCRPNLTQTIKRLNPKIIIPLGSRAVSTLFRQLWKEGVGAITRWVGQIIPCHTPNAWICPNYHPRFAMAQKNGIGELLFKKYLAAAVKQEGRPWLQIPNLLKRVKVIMDPRQAANSIKTIMAFGKPIAFDFETDRGKPYPAEAEIVSCSISNGVDTIAYPLVGKAIEATKIILESTLPKFGHNMKFETNWTRIIFKRLGYKCEVNNWIFDSMLSAHWLDYRSNITSLKFQAFVNFGQPDYDSEIAPYLKRKYGNEQNRIHEIETSRLLLYNGLDSLLTVMLCRAQMKKAGIKICQDHLEQVTA